MPGEQQSCCQHADTTHCMQDALERGRHTASTFRLLASAAAATAAAEAATYALAGDAVTAMWYVGIGAVMVAYRLKEKTGEK